MATTYSSLTANIDLMRSGNEDVLKVESYSDSALLALYKDASKAEMKMDIEAALSIEFDDTTTLDAVTDKYATRLSRALSYKQLCTYYQRVDDGEGMKNRHRWDLYKEMYNREKSTFGTLSKNAPVAAVSSQVFMR